MKNFAKFCLYEVVLLSLLFPTIVSASVQLKLSLSQQQAFTRHMVIRHHFNYQQLTQLFAKVKLQPQAIQLMKQPHEAKPWYKYRSLLVTPDRIAGGVKFWHEHAKLLSQIEQKYGVPTNIIVAVLGIESNYAAVQGNFKVLDTLFTLAFSYPRRSAYFRHELEQFLLLAREAKLDPNLIYGSYSGAIGQPQFMPSTYRQYAVAYKHAGYSNLFSNDADVIASIANYFKRHGWRKGAPITVKAQIMKNKYLAIAHYGLRSKITIASLQCHGVTASVPIAPTQQVTFLRLQQQQGYEYWIGLPNFYVLSSYNPSLNYTMAVFQLAQQIATHYYLQPTN